MKTDSPYKFAGIIPARYRSSRFPGKPLALIGSKPMIQLVYEQVAKSLKIVFVATDDKRIYDTVINFGGKAIMTSANHLSGTDRCAEAAAKIETETGIKIDIVINIQGDEPFIKPEQIDLIMNCFQSEDIEIAKSTLERFNQGSLQTVTGAAGGVKYIPECTKGTTKKFATENNINGENSFASFIY